MRYSRLYSAALCALIAAGCGDDSSLKCGPGTLEKDDVCLPETNPPEMNEEPEWSLGVDLGQYNAEGDVLSKVDTVYALDLQVYESQNQPLHVGFPVLIDLTLDVTAEPFETDVFIGLESKDGSKGCVIGRAKVTHQPEAFEAAKRANEASLYSAVDVAKSSYADCASERTCADANEACVSYDVAAEPKEGAAPDEPLELTQMWSCVQKGALDNAQRFDEPASAADFGERKQGTLYAKLEQLLPKTCEGLIGEANANMWLSFDPFRNTNYVERVEVEAPQEVTEASLLEFVRKQRLPFSSCGAQELGKAGPPKCNTGLEIKANPGRDFRMRELNLATSVFVPVAQEDSAKGQSDLSVSTEFAVYGVPEDEAKGLEDEEIPMTFSMRPVPNSAMLPDGVTPTMEELDWIDVKVMEQKGVKAGTPELKLLEEALLDLLEPVTIFSKHYELSFEQSHRQLLMMGNLQYYDQFELRVCAAPAFSEGAGLSENNCTIRTIIKTEDLNNLPTDVGGGASLCTEQVVADYGAAKSRAESAEEAAKIRNFYYVSDASWERFAMHHYYNWPDGKLVADREYDLDYLWARAEWKDLTADQRHQKLEQWWTNDCFHKIHEGATVEQVPQFNCKHFFGKVAQRYTLDEKGRIQDLPEDNAWFDTVYYYKELAKIREQQAMLAFKAVAVLCQDSDKGFTDNEAQLLGKFVDLGKSGATSRMNGMQIGYSAAFRNDIMKKRYARDFKIVVGPEAKIYLDANSPVSSWDIYNIIGAKALIHAHSIGVGSWFEMSLEALTLTLFSIEFNLPESWELVDPPTFSRDIAKCQTFTPAGIPIEVCGRLGGELGINVGLSLEGIDDVGKLSGTVTPYITTNAEASIAISLFLIKGGVRVNIDPLAEFKFPATASVEWQLTLNEGARRIDYRITPSLEIKNEREFLKGEIIGFVNPGFEGVIYSWSGLESSDVLFNYTPRSLTGSLYYQ